MAAAFLWGRKRSPIVANLLTAEISATRIGRGLVDAFFMGTDATKSTTNHATAYCAEAANATVSGTPSYGSGYARLSGSGYIQTTSREMMGYTILCVCRINNAGANLGVSFANNYALDLGVNNGSTKFGMLGIIQQAGASDYTGTISNRVGCAKPHLTSPAINYANPSLAVADTRTWRLIALVVNPPALSGDGGSNRVIDLTNGTSYNGGGLGTGWYRLPNVVTPIRIGNDQTGYFNGSIDVSAWLHWNRALSDAEMRQLRKTLTPYFAAKGIAI